MTTITCPNPVFIIGAPRSGTTILAYALAQHSQFWTGGECHLLWRMFGADLTDKFEREKEFPGLIRKGEVEREEFLEYLGLGINALFTSRSRGKRWIDQTPVNTLMVDDLADMFPGALFLHILRDAYRVVNSMIHFAQANREEVRSTIARVGYYPTWATDFAAACRMWSDSVTAAMTFASKRPDRCLTIRHEALVAEPSKAFDAIFEFLGVEREDLPAKYSSNVQVNSSFAPAAKAAAPNPWDQWTPSQRLTFREVAEPVAVRYGLPIERELTEEHDGAVRRFRDTVSRHVPAGATILVVSKGDDDWLHVDGRRSAHFPATSDNVYAGFHPAHSADAIAQLESARARGAEYLAFPYTSLWWLDHYQQFRGHLDLHHQCIWRDARCVIYRLQPARADARA